MTSLEEEIETSERVSVPTDIEIGDNDERTLAQLSQSKYAPYDLKVDPVQGDRASEFKLFSAKRPHMRAFHFAWWSYHVAFLMW